MKDIKDYYRIGITVFLLLATLTIGEFAIGAVAIGWSAPLILIAVIKAALIMRDYMHIGRVFAPEEETHS